MSLESPRTVSQQEDLHDGFFITQDPAHCDAIRAACYFAVWVPHTSRGPLLGFGRSEQFSGDPASKNSHCYEWEIGEAGIAKANPVDRLSL